MTLESQITTLKKLVATKDAALAGLEKTKATLANQLADMQHHMDRLNARVNANLGGAWPDADLGWDRQATDAHTQSAGQPVVNNAGGSNVIGHGEGQDQQDEQQAESHLKSNKILGTYIQVMMESRLAEHQSELATRDEFILGLQAQITTLKQSVEERDISIGDLEEIIGMLQTQEEADWPTDATDYLEDDNGEDRGRPTHRTGPPRAGLSPSGSHNARLCHFVKSGKCRYGKECNFRHPGICKIWQAESSCRFGRDCPFLHPNSMQTAKAAVEGLPLNQ